MARPFSTTFTAQKIFTDREDAKKILRLSVETEQKFDEYRIKVFYGVGGQGKSYLKNIFLVNEYLKPLAEENKNILYCDTIDFEKDESKKQPDEALLAIAKTLIEKGNFALPAFILGFLKYKSLSSSSLNLSETYPFLFRLPGKMTASPLANEILTEIVHFAAEGLTTSIPIIGLFIKKLWDKGKDKIVDWIRKSDVKNILADLDTLDKFSLLERLPKLLAYDVFKALENDYNNNGKQERRLIIIFDGYETLWQNSKNEDINKDKWIRTLAYYLPGVLFIIFGRDRLRWSEVERDEEFISAIDQHLIKGLSDNDADSFLKFVPIENPEIRNSIIQNSKGSHSNDGCLPLYLDIEVNTYEQIINQGGKPSKQDFEQGNEKTELEVVNRFFKHISPELSNSIGALSLSNYFDTSIIQLLKHLYCLPPAVSLDDLDNFSFIYVENDKANIHSLVREIASEQYKKKFPDNYFKIHEALFNYFNHQLPSSESQEMTPQFESVLANAAHHKEIYDVTNFPKWIFDKSYYLFGIGYYDTLDTQLKHAIKLIKNTSEKSFAYSQENKVLLGNLYFKLSDNNKYTGRLLLANEYIQAALEVYNIIFPNDFFDQFSETGAEQKVTSQTRESITSFKNGLELAASIKTGMGKNNECGKLYAKALKIATLFSLPFNRYGFATYLINIGRVAEAEPWFFNQYNFEIYNNNLLGAALAAHDFAKLLKVQERFEEAIFYQKIAIDIYTRVKTKNHAYTGIAMHALASILTKQGKDLVQAEQLLNEAWDIYVKNFRIDNVMFGFLYADMFSLALKKDVNAALQYYYRAKEIISDYSGNMNARYITMLIDIADQLKKTPINANDEFTPLIINYFLNEFDNLKELLSIYNSALHTGISITADFLESQGKKELAELFRKKKKEFIRILEVRTHIRTASLTTEIIKSPTKENILSQFKQITSLPDDTSSVELERIILPFYKTYNLFQITFLNAEKMFYKYILFDNVTPIAIDWNARNILNVNEVDINLNATSVIPYIIFFCDSISGEKGKFYLLLDDKDIPWRQDIDIDEKLKFAIKQKIKPIVIKSENGNSFMLQGYIVFQDFIYRCEIKVDKTSGALSMLYDEPVQIYKYNDVFICKLFSDEDKPNKNKNCIELDSLPCCIDPLYEAKS